MRIRVAGLYIQNNEILLVEHQKENRSYFLLPGGGAEEGETLIEALKREFTEELSVQIEVGEFLWLGEVRDPTSVSKAHVLQLVFAIRKLNGEIRVNPDGRLVGFRYLPSSEFMNNAGGVPLFPDCKDQFLAYLAKNQNFPLYKEYIWL